MNDAAVCGFNSQKQKDSWWFRKRDLDVSLSRSIYLYRNSFNVKKINDMWT